MKKSFIFIICIVIIVVSAIGVKYADYKAEKNKIKENNLIYEDYLDKEIYGTELVTVINMAINNNEKNNVTKDENSLYVQNDTNSIEVEIKISDNDSTYKMETINKGGIENFVQYYNAIYFKCTKITYNSKGKVNYVLFEQITN